MLYGGRSGGDTMPKKAVKKAITGSKKLGAPMYHWQVSLRNNTSTVVTAETLAVNPDSTLVFTSGGVVGNVINADLYSMVAKN
jgi:hypothetical protein